MIFFINFRIVNNHFPNLSLTYRYHYALHASYIAVRIIYHRFLIFIKTALTKDMFCLRIHYFVYIWCFKGLFMRVIVSYINGFPYHAMLFCNFCIILNGSTRYCTNPSSHFQKAPLFIVYFLQKWVSNIHIKFWVQIYDFCIQYFPQRTEVNVDSTRANQSEVSSILNLFLRNVLSFELERNLLFGNCIKFVEIYRSDFMSACFGVKVLLIS